MGQSPSTSLPSSLPELALHCLRVADASPSSGLIEPYFDYLIGVEADPTSTPLLGGPNGLDELSEGIRGLSPVDLGRVLDSHEGRRIGLKVYNAKSQRIRGKSPYRISLTLARGVALEADMMQTCRLYRVESGQ